MVFFCLVLSFHPWNTEFFQLKQLVFEILGNELFEKYIEHLSEPNHKVPQHCACSNIHDKYLEQIDVTDHAVPANIHISGFI